MKFNIDENLPIEIKDRLQIEQHDALMVYEHDHHPQKRLRHWVANVK